MANESKSKTIGCIVFLCVSLVLIVICGLLFTTLSKNNGTKTNEPDEYAGYAMCQLFMEDKLVAPSTAKYPALSLTKWSFENKIFKITSYVDAQNNFGAMLRKNYYCEVEYQGNDKWKLNDLQIFE